MHDLERYFEVALVLTKDCGVLVREAINAAKNVQTKSSDIDLVTETDQEVERLLIFGLRREFPSHKFIGEETTASGVKCVLTDDPTWIIDPVDGTMNFVHNLPLVAISVGLFINKKPAIGIIYNPLLDQLFTAKVGQGAFLNGAPIHVSEQAELAQALICSEVGTNKDPERIKVVLNNLSKLIGKVHGIRALGSAALNMASVASGGTDAYFEFGIHAWDIAAGELIITEAGGCVIDTAGGPLDIMNRRVLCAASEPLARKLAEILDQYELERD